MSNPALSAIFFLVVLLATAVVGDFPMPFATSLHPITLPGPSPFAAQFESQTLVAWPFLNKGLVRHPQLVPTDHAQHTLTSLGCTHKGSSDNTCFLEGFLEGGS